MGTQSRAPSKYDAFATEHAARIDGYLDALFASETSKARARGLPAATAELNGVTRDFLRGGKKMRGVLVALGFDMVRGWRSHVDDIENVTKASTAFEIMHSGLLIHDDIMDRDEVRRGGDAFHVIFAKKFDQRDTARSNSSAEHHGVSMGINGADAAVFLAIELMATLTIAPERVVQVIGAVARAFRNTAYGQLLDIDSHSSDRVTESQIWNIYTYKTAYYSVVSPLQVGAMIAGTTQEHLDALHEFGVPLGQAFQLMDDLLGLFGDEARLGKPVGSDLKEGKKTLIAFKLLEALESGESEVYPLLSVLLKYGAMSEEAVESLIPQVRELATSTGALSECEDRARGLALQSRELIPSIAEDAEVRETLGAFVDFVITRQF